MQPRPPDSWPPRPPPAHGIAEPGLWRPPPAQQFERDHRGHHQGGEDYGGHYASHSQYYHPERQRRHREPESFWFTQHPPLPPPPPSPHSYHPPPPPPPPPPAWDQWQTESYPHWTGQQQQPPSLTCSSVTEPPSLVCGSVTESVSAVDLIKGYRTDDGDETGTPELFEEESKPAEEREQSADSKPPPPWLDGEERDGERGSQVTDVTAERGREVRAADEEKKEEKTEEKEEMEEGEEEKYEDSFVAEVRRFVQRTAETFDLVTKEELVSDRGPTLHNFRSEDSFKYAEPGALEYHMQIPKVMRRQSFFKLVEPGDVMQGHVVAKRYSGLAVQITSFVNSHKYRELSDLAIRGVVPLDNLAENRDKCEEVMRDMQLDDVVQAVVVTVDLEEETLVLTFQASDLSGVEPASLGYRAGRRPASPRPSAIKDNQFLEELEGNQGFINPEAGNTLYRSLGLAAATSFRHTLHNDLQIADYAEGDFAEPLRRAQRFKWSMKMVAVGVNHFKSGRHEQARQVLNHALDIDPSNVEGLVARGALSATTGLFKDGIVDFRKALSLKASHTNARNYLVETQVVYGKRLEAQGRVEEAMESYREALELDPREETARGRLEALVAAMEIKTARLKERARQEAEEQEKLARVRKVIEKEKRKQLKEKKKPKRKKRRKSGEGKKRRKKTSKKKAHYSSRSEEEDSAESESDGDEGGRSIKKAKGGKERRKREHKKSSRRKSARDSSPSDSYDSEETTTSTKRSKYSSEDEKAAAASRKRSKYSSEDRSTEDERGEEEGERGRRKSRERGESSMRRKPVKKTRSPSPRRQHDSTSSSESNNSSD